MVKKERNKNMTKEEQNIITKRIIVDLKPKYKGINLLIAINDGTLITDIKESYLEEYKKLSKEELLSMAVDESFRQAMLGVIAGLKQVMQR